MDRLAEGVLAYRRHPVHRDLENPPAVWSEGNTRLLDMAPRNRAARARGTRAVLVVPSLINRWEVLDLTAEKSLLRAMAAEGLRPYLVDWGTPDADERRFDPTAYVARLERALGLRHQARAAGAGGDGLLHGRHARRGAGRAPAAPGRRPRPAGGTRGTSMPIAPATLSCCRSGPMLARVADQVGELPVDVLQTLFWSLDPWLAVKKFGRFLGMDQQGDSAREFVLLEDWLNEGAPLAGPTARECLVGWYGDNLPGTGKWIVGGRRIVPSKIGDAVAGHDPVGRPHRAAAVGRGAGRTGPRAEARHAARPAARPHRHGGERPRPRALLDAADRLVE